MSLKVFLQKILKISFDALEEKEQQIFLDIACFFKGYELVEVEDILSAHFGVSVKYHIRVIVDKCLIKIDPFPQILKLHDLVEDMGKEIVRQESPQDAGERSRLWLHQDIIQVLEENKGSRKTQIIILNFPYYEKGVVDWDGKALEKMENLKTLIIRNAVFCESPKHLPNSLRVLEWWEYPS
ncbi:putative winged helix-turn-helix DNA-binding domain, leucine-rich repeat domain, L [Lupinus albus]|uniref:Putative winged helix-turn-helix DNA-binding domain, leucine-rich repeat domain, L n=1 Tax=Lupinus albus TaxID=3870 RepID=A0A6A4MYD7_LUPAL|nr:putative winged helix-turn-helix DNA-binding domain, leucine-rich repeat domain, L [Lupinus albus]